MTRWGFILLVIWPLASWCRAQDGQDSLTLAFATESGQSVVAIDITSDGILLPQKWNTFFESLYRYCDRDNNQSLDRSEANRLPSPFSLRQRLWGQFVPDRNRLLDFVKLDSNDDSQVSLDEMASYYRSQGFGRALVSYGKAPLSNLLTDALLKQLDTNLDSAVDQSEWEAGSSVLFQLDRNNDELVGAGELLEGATYPGITGAEWLPVLEPHSTESHSPVFVMLKQSDLQLPETVSVHWKVAFKDQSPATDGPPNENSQRRLASYEFKTDSLTLRLNAVDGKLPALFTAGKGRIFNQFAQCDQNGDGHLDEKELRLPSADLFVGLMPFDDRDEDGKLQRSELAGWWDLQETLVDTLVIITILDFGNGLFELLDSNNDGALSVVETRSAWRQLETAGVIENGNLLRSRLPRQFRATVSFGTAIKPMSPVSPLAPKWFTAMDRNGDGEVSKQEFMLSPTLFLEIDSDSDGLIAPIEANMFILSKPFREQMD